MDRNLMEVERPIKKPKQIIIGNDATLKQRLIAIKGCQHRGSTPT